LESALLKRPIPLVRTYVENLLEYAIGRPLEYYDEPAVRAIAKSAEADKYPMQSLILGVVKSDAFEMRKVETATDTTATKATTKNNNRN